jgi:hypothetical protein
MLIGDPADRIEDGNACMEVLGGVCDVGFVGVWLGGTFIEGEGGGPCNDDAGDE